MKLIGFTSENTLPNEGKLIEVALDCGLDYIHVRKPLLSELELFTLISTVSPKYYGQIVIHDHFSLVQKLKIGGVHLNRRSPLAPVGYSGRISRSCHSFGELGTDNGYAYCTLSPIFDAISKSGYTSKFTQNELKNAQKSGFLGQNTIALGGICAENVSKIAEIGFAGVAVLGYLWQNPTVESVAERVRLLRVEIDKIIR